jgi:hypothetical protein
LQPHSGGVQDIVVGETQLDPIPMTYATGHRTLQPRLVFPVGNTLQGRCLALPEGTTGSLWGM